MSDKENWTSYQPYSKLADMDGANINEASIIKQLPDNIHKKFEFFMDEVADVTDITLWEKTFHAIPMVHMETTTSQH